MNSRKKVVVAEIGSVVVVEGEIMFDNDMGGTEIAEKGRWTVRLTKSFYDYETGQRCVGELTRVDQVARLRRLGITGFAGKKTPNRDAGWTWNPAKVYFYADQIVGAGDGDILIGKGQ